MSVESWGQGQSNQRQRTIVASGSANGPVDAAYFAEPQGAATPAKAMGAPPDASNKADHKPANKKPAATKAPPVSPSTTPKGE